MLIIMTKEATVDLFLQELELYLQAIRDALVARPTESQAYGIVQYLEEVIEAVLMVEMSLPETELSAFLDAVTELIGHLHSQAKCSLPY